jgi:hypothetical protein
MAHFARIVDGTVKEVIAFDPDGKFPADWTWVECPADTRQGATYAGKTFTNPELPEPDPAEPAPAFRTQVTRTEFYGLFTAEEEAMGRLMASEEVTPAAFGAADAAEKARLSAVMQLGVMFRRIDALGPTDRIDLANAQVAEGLDLWRGLDLITEDRRAEIAKGVPEG